MGGWAPSAPRPRLRAPFCRTRGDVTHATTPRRPLRVQQPPCQPERLLPSDGTVRTPGAQSPPEPCGLGRGGRAGSSSGGPAVHRTQRFRDGFYSGGKLCQGRSQHKETSNKNQPGREQDVSSDTSWPSLPSPAPPWFSGHMQPWRLSVCPSDTGSQESSAPSQLQGTKEIVP